MAASLVAKVLQNTKIGDEEDKDDWNVRISKLSSCVHELKKNISNTVTSLYDDFIPVLLNFDELKNKLAELDNEAKRLKETLNSLMKHDLVKSQTELSSLMSQYKCNRLRVDVLTNIFTIVQYLEENASCLDHRKFTQAATKLTEVNETLTKHLTKNTPFVDTKIYKSLRRELTIRREELMHELDKAWKYAIVWKNIGEEEEDDYHPNTPCLELKFSAKEGGISAQDMVYSLALFNNLDYKLATFANDIVTRIFQPLIKSGSLTPFINEKEEDGVASLELLEVEVDVKHEVSLEATTFKHVYDCLAFLHRNFFKLKVKTQENGSGDIVEDCLMKMLSDLTCERIMKLLIETCLERTVPDTKDELEKYDQVVSIVDTFEASLRQIDFLTKDKKGSLMEFCSNIDSHFANRRNTLILSNAKSMMKKDLLETIEVSNETVLQLSSHLSQQLHSAAHGGDDKLQLIQSSSVIKSDATTLPSFRVSKFVMELMELIHTTIAEAGDTSLESSVKLLSTISSILDFYQAVVPNDHKRSLTSLPQASAIFYNNCWFISHQLTEINSQYEEGGITHPYEFVDQIPRIRESGMDCFISQMRNQKEELMGCLEPLQQLATDHEKYKTCERCVKQILYQLNRLGKVWLSVLPVAAVRTCIIILVDSCLAQITKSIIAIEDMVASDPEQLRMACILLQEKIPFLFLFGDMNKASTDRDLTWQREMKNWQRMKELIFVLDASMSEIVDRWADGKGPLADCLAMLEVRSLIRALFQNTDMRAKAISRIA